MGLVQDEVRAWKPAVPGIAEVLHAHWADHAYPVHTHDTWTLLLVDDGVIGYDLDRRDNAALRSGVTLLPPHVPHDGHALTPDGFRKRVVYLEYDQVPAELIAAAVDSPYIDDPQLRHHASHLDRSLTAHDDSEAESRLALVAERLTWHLRGRPSDSQTEPSTGVARRAREMLDADPVGTQGIRSVATALDVSTAHLVRAFTREYALPPHRYLIGRRLDLARRLLLDGRPPALVAQATGFYDQAHLTRHFRQLLATTPGRYQRSA